MSKLAVHVWLPGAPNPNMKIWTLDEDVYIEVYGVTYVQLKSAISPPSFLWMLVSVFQAECTGNVSKSPFKHVNLAVNTCEKMNRSESRIKVSFDLVWSCDNGDYVDADYSAVFVVF